MNYLITYDISDDNLPTIASETLKDYGLRRIQKSAFLGKLKKHKLNCLITDFHKIITQDSMLVFPVCDSDFGNIISIGREFIKDGETKEIEFY